MACLAHRNISSAGLVGDRRLADPKDWEPALQRFFQDLTSWVLFSLAGVFYGEISNKYR